MYFKQFYLGCLAQASYLIGSNADEGLTTPKRVLELQVRAFLPDGAGGGAPRPARVRKKRG